MRGSVVAVTGTVYALRTVCGRGLGRLWSLHDALYAAIAILAPRTRRSVFRARFRLSVALIS